MILGRCGRRYDIAKRLKDTYGEGTFDSHDMYKLDPDFRKVVKAMRQEGVIKLVKARTHPTKPAVYRLTQEAIERINRYEGMGY